MVNRKGLTEKEADPLYDDASDHTPEGIPQAPTERRRKDGRYPDSIRITGWSQAEAREMLRHYRS